MRRFTQRCQLQQHRLRSQCLGLARDGERTFNVAHRQAQGCAGRYRNVPDVTQQAIGVGQCRQCVGTYGGLHFAFNHKLGMYRFGPGVQYGTHPTEDLHQPGGLCKSRAGAAQPHQQVDVFSA